MESGISKRRIKGPESINPHGRNTVQTNKTVREKAHIQKGKKVEFMQKQTCNTMPSVSIPPPPPNDPKTPRATSKYEYQNPIHTHEKG